MSVNDPAYKIRSVNKSKIKVKAYNEFADYCYQKLKQEDTIFVQGYLDSNMHIIVEKWF